MSTGRTAHEMARILYECAQKAGIEHRLKQWPDLTAEEQFPWYRMNDELHDRVTAAFEPQPPEPN